MPVTFYSAKCYNVLICRRVCVCDSGFLYVFFLSEERDSAAREKSLSSWSFVMRYIFIAEMCASECVQRIFPFQFFRWVCRSRMCFRVSLYLLFTMSYTHTMLALKLHTYTYAHMSSEYVGHIYDTYHFRL